MTYTVEQAVRQCRLIYARRTVRILDGHVLDIPSLYSGTWMIPTRQKRTAITTHREDYRVDANLYDFPWQCSSALFFIVWKEGATAGAFTGRVLLSILQDATAMAFIPSALYVVFRLVRH